jgi:Flp pilus assembly protein TadG
MVEAAFVLIVFLGFIFLIFDVSWAIFAKATLQHAVRAGVRYAVTSRTILSGGTQLGHVASIKQVVQSESMGFLSASDVSSRVTVTFWSVSSNPPAQVTVAGANSAGNMVVVSVNGWNLNPLAPLLRSSSPVQISVSSGDLIESSGSGGAPPPL